MHPNKLALATLILGIALLTGCGSMMGSAPKTPDSMIQNAKNGKMFTQKDSFEVKRPLVQVSDVLKKKAHECFEQEISFTSQGDSSGGMRLKQRQSRALTPKVIVDKQRTRLTMQVKSTGGSTDLGDIPHDGWYMMVVDAYPVDKNTTRVESYYQQTSYKGAFTAVKLWVTGTDMNCPDLTQ